MSTTPYYCVLRQCWDVVRSSFVDGEQIGSLCSGIGGLDIAVEQVTGARPAWFAEIDAPASAVLAEHWPDVPNVGDLRTADLPPVDVLTAGFPCQDLSAAGRKAGIRGTKSGLWWDIAEVIGRVRPRLVVLENVPRLVTGADQDEEGEDADGSGSVGRDRMVEPARRPVRRPWLGAVLGSLAELGYVGSWGVVRSADVGAPHTRARWFACAQPVGGEPVRPVTGPPARLAMFRGHVLPTPTVSQPGGSVEAFIARKARNGMPPHVTDLGMVVERLMPDEGYGPWTPAVDRWVHVHGQPAPPAKIDGRLNPDFVEWMMGYPAGWTARLARTNRLRVLGNAVQPQTAVAAISALLGRMNGSVASGTWYGSVQ